MKLAEQKGRFLKLNEIISGLPDDIKAKLTDKFSLNLDENLDFQNLNLFGEIRSFILGSSLYSDIPELPDSQHPTAAGNYGLETLMSGVLGFLLGGGAVNALNTFLIVCDIIVDVVDTLEEEVEKIRKNPDCESYSPSYDRLWNMQLGKALNYGHPSDDIVKKRLDGSYDFSKLLKFHPVNRQDIDLWLSDELKILLNINMERTS